MDSNKPVQKEFEEIQRQLRGVEIEIERIAKEMPGLDERVRLAEQKNLEAQTRLGLDPVDILPSPEVQDALTKRDQRLTALERLNQRKRELHAREAEIRKDHLETELVALSRRQSTLHRRVEELEAEIATLREEIARIQTAKEEAAIELARASENPEED